MFSSERLYKIKTLLGTVFWLTVLLISALWIFYPNEMLNLSIGGV